MRIFSKRAFEFGHPAGEQPAVAVRAQDFAVVPDWVVDSLMYKLALADGDVMPIESKQDEIQAELGSPDKTTRAKARELAKAQKKSESDAAAATAETAVTASVDASGDPTPNAGDPNANSGDPNAGAGGDPNASQQ